MLPVLELSCTLLLQAHISLVHQGGTLQSVVGTFVPQVMMRYAAELVVDKRNGRAKGIVVTGVPVRQ
jgi:hypothetical protein